VLQLRQINGFIKIKIIMLCLETLIFIILKLKIKIYLQNILLIKGLVIFPVLESIIKKPTLRYQLFIILFSSFFFFSRLLADYISQILSSGKQHLKILKRFILFFESFFYSNILLLQGVQLRVTGKLGGKMRASKFHYKIGSVNLQKIISFCNYNLSVAYTKYGILAIKL